MKKTTKLWFYFHLLFLGVINTIFFLLKGFDNSISVWVSYGVIHFAYIVTWFLPFLRSKSSSMFAISSKVLIQIYFWLELAVGITFIILDLPDWRIVVVVQLLLFFFPAVGAIFSMMGDEYSKQGKPLLDQDSKASMISDYVKMSKSKLETLARVTIQMDLKMQVNELFETFKALKIKEEKNTQQLLDLTTKYSIAVTSKDREAIEIAKSELLNYVQD